MAHKLYSFRRCPYAMRARMAILQSGISCELSEVVLRDKPQDMLDISPKGTVPVLLTHDGDVLDESLDIMMWALKQSDGAAWLSPQLGNLDAALALIAHIDQDFKPHLDRYKYPNRYEGVSALDNKAKGQVILAELNQRLASSTYLFGKQPCIADIAVAPFVRQFAYVDKIDFDANGLGHLHRWLSNFLGSAAFLSVMHKNATFIN